ncbi:Hypothetical protein, putative [Bodo saltans]|uniref:Uncharacterized protein n=1 Tax=Bodo saltans TaxID=75058 RepID=A0A0S4KIC6_BODSA|nr:Hypothetical protein, putative [Bodo saltans]|eukprot:CUI14151.1 Hypothetical protein, putative [Bodo saltans]
MFHRRVASSCGIPRAMWHSMHIMSQRQASRILPPLVSMSSQSVVLPATGAALTVPASMMLASSEALNSLAQLGMSSSCVAQWINANILLLQVLSDTMCFCTYTVVERSTSTS